MCRADDKDSISIIFQLCDLENTKLLTLDSLKVLVIYI